MIKSTAQRQRAVNAAVGSVRAEGLKPSAALQRDLRAFVRGKTSLESVRKSTVVRIANSSRSAK